MRGDEAPSIRGRVRYRKAKREGVCPRCGRPAERGRVTCARHAEEYRLRSQQYRTKMRGRGGEKP